MKHQDNISEYMDEYKKEVNAADLIYLNAPGLNKMFFLAEGKPLNHLKD